MTEREFERLLIEHKIFYYPQYRIMFQDGRHWADVDFFLPSTGIVVEIDGWRHFHGPAKYTDGRRSAKIHLAHRNVSLIARIAGSTVRQGVRHPEIARLIDLAKSQVNPPKHSADFLAKFPGGLVSVRKTSPPTEFTP